MGAVTVAWQDDQVGLRAVWARTNESVDWIAAATDTFVTGLRGLLDRPDWLHRARAPWPAEPEAQRALVASSEVVIEDKVFEGEYSVDLYGSPPPSPHLQVSAGGRHPGGRIPLHSAGLGFDPRFTPLPRREVVDDLIALAVRACQPAVVTFTTTAVNKESGRTGWQVPAGYRVWIGPEVGGISTTADGVTARPLEGGTLLSAPDDWEASAVAEAMNATLEANHLDEIPHGAA